MKAVRVVSTTSGVLVIVFISLGILLVPNTADALVEMIMELEKSGDDEYSKVWG